MRQPATPQRCSASSACGSGAPVSDRHRGPPGRETARRCSASSRPTQPRHNAAPRQARAAAERRSPTGIAAHRAAKPHIAIQPRHAPPEPRHNAAPRQARAAAERRSPTGIAAHRAAKPHIATQPRPAPPRHAATLLRVRRVTLVPKGRTRREQPLPQARRVENRSRKHGREIEQIAVSTNDVHRLLPPLRVPGMAGPSDHDKQGPRAARPHARPRTRGDTRSTDPPVRRASAGTSDTTTRASTPQRFRD